MFKKRMIASVLSVVMIMTVVQLNVVAADETTLVTIGVGEIYEYRNLTGRTQQLRIESTGESYIDRYGYTSSGSYSHNGGGSWRNSRIKQGSASTVSVSAGGMFVLEFKSGSAITVYGDREVFKITQLITPVFYVQSISPGVTIEFLNSGTGEHSVGYGGNLGEVFDVHFIRSDGTVTPTKNVYSSGSGAANPGDKIVLTGRHYRNGRDYSYELRGEYTAFSGQPYRLTIDGQKSYPPGIGADSNPIEPVQTEFSINNKISMMRDFIARTNGIKPFEGFQRAYDLAIKRTSQLAGVDITPAQEQRAYYKTILSAIRNEQYSVLRTLNDVTNGYIELIPFSETGNTIGDFVMSLFRSSDFAVPAESDRFSPNEITMLIDLLDAAPNNHNMKTAIYHLFTDFTGEEDLLRMIRNIELMQQLMQESTTQEAIGQLRGEAIKRFLTDQEQAIYKALKFVVDFNDVARSANEEAVADIIALQGIREAVWTIWDGIISNGQSREFTDTSLIRAYDIYNLSRYLALEQITKSILMLDLPANLIFDWVSWGSGIQDSNWQQDVLIQDDLKYIRNAQNPLDYDPFRQFQYFDERTDYGMFVRLYNDGNYSWFLLDEARSDGTIRKFTTAVKGTYRIESNNVAVTDNGKRSFYTISHDGRTLTEVDGHRRTYKLTSGMPLSIVASNNTPPHGRVSSGRRNESA